MRGQKLKSLSRSLGRAVRIAVRVVVLYLLSCTFLTVLYGYALPPVTGVQVQRRIEALIAGESPSLDIQPVPRDALPDHLLHAVVAAEDGRFYDHHGLDLQAIRQAARDNQRGTRARRGGSTITQQLVKNLFMTTHGSWVRKAFEVPLALIVDLVLTKDRILVLYLNTAEWGPAQFGAEAGSRLHYGKSATRLSRTEAAGLASLLPAPRRRTPQNTGTYRSTILRRMAQMGW